MPSALEQGGWTADTLKQSATGWGTELRAAGVNLDLAPVMDVVPVGTAASNAPIGALDRQFGSDPAGNGAHGAAFIRAHGDRLFVQGAPALGTDPNPQNARAIRAYEKAGFVRGEVRDTDWGLSLLMIRYAP